MRYLVYPEKNVFYEPNRGFFYAEEAAPIDADELILLASPVMAYTDRRSVDEVLASAAAEKHQFLASVSDNLLVSEFTMGYWDLIRSRGARLYPDLRGFSEPVCIYYDLSFFGTEKRMVKWGFADQSGWREMYSFDDDALEVAMRTFVESYYRGGVLELDKVLLLSPFSDAPAVGDYGFRVDVVQGEEALRRIYFADYPSAGIELLAKDKYAAYLREKAEEAKQRQRKESKRRLMILAFYLLLGCCVSAGGMFSRALLGYYLDSQRQTLERELQRRQEFVAERQKHDELRRRMSSIIAALASTEKSPVYDRLLQFEQRNSLPFLELSFSAGSSRASVVAADNEKLMQLSSSYPFTSIDASKTDKVMKAEVKGK